MAVWNMKLKTSYRLPGMKHSESLDARYSTMTPIRQLWNTMYFPPQAVLWSICDAIASASAMHETAIETVNENKRNPFISQLLCKDPVVVGEIGFTADLLDVVIHFHERSCAESVDLLDNLVVCSGVQDCLAE